MTEQIRFGLTELAMLILVVLQKRGMIFQFEMQSKINERARKAELLLNFHEKVLSYGRLIWEEQEAVFNMAVMRLTT